MRKRATERDRGLKNISPRELLDENEQEEEISRLERQISQSSSSTARTASVLAATLCAIHLYFAAVQYQRPFSLRHHAPFADLYDGQISLCVGEVASALAVGTSGLAIFRFVHPRADGLSWKYALNSAILVTALQMIYWVAAGASVYILSSSASVLVPWGLIWWKPVPAMLMFIMAVMSIDSISKMQIDLGLLKRSRYRFKKI